MGSNGPKGLYAFNMGFQENPLECRETFLSSYSWHKFFGVLIKPGWSYVLLSGPEIIIVDTLVHAELTLPLAKSGSGWVLELRALPEPCPRRPVLH